MLNWIVRDTLQYLEQFKFVDLCKVELLVTEIFDHSAVCIYKMGLQIIYLIYK